MDAHETKQRMIGAGAAVGGAASLTVLAVSEAVLGPAQDLSDGGDGDPLRIAVSILFSVASLAAFAAALLMLRTIERPPGSPAWPSTALALAATLFAVSGAMIVVGRLIDWWPEVLLGVVNLPAILLLGAGWIVVARSSYRRHGPTWRGLLLFALAGLGAVLLPLAAVGGPLLLLAEALFIAGWLLVARLIWSGTDVAGEGLPAR